jgi:hypothetical protein
VTLACPNWDEIGMTRSGDSGAFRPSPPAPRQLNVQAAQRARRRRRCIGFASVFDSNRPRKSRA